MAVCAQVVSTRYGDSSKGQPTFINLDKPYPNQIFTVVIWVGNRGKFGKPEDDSKGNGFVLAGESQRMRVSQRLSRPTPSM